MTKSDAYLCHRSFLSLFSTGFILTGERCGDERETEVKIIDTRDKETRKDTFDA